MKDYSTNSFEQKTFILNYQVILEESAIIVYYADGSTQKMPYNKKQEIVLLKKMKNQVLNNWKNYKKLIKDLKNVNFKDKLMKIFFAIYMGLVIGSALNNPINAGIFLLLTGYSMKNIIKSFKSNRLLIKKYRLDMYEYEKNFNFVNNEEVFSNARIMKPSVISSVSPNVLCAINNRIMGEEYFKNKDLFSGAPLIDYAIVPNTEEIASEEYKQAIINAEKEYTDNGYYDISTYSTPLLDVNSISALSYDEVYDTYKASVAYEGEKGKVLAKVLTYNERK